MYHKNNNFIWVKKSNEIKREPDTVLRWSLDPYGFINGLPDRHLMFPLR